MTFFNLKASLTKWIVLTPTLRGLLKSVQDRTSRSFGGRETKETKVQTILRDNPLLDTVYENPKILMMVKKPGK